MTAKLTLQLSDEVLDALRHTGHLQIQLTSARAAPGAAASPRPGSLPAKILAWAERRKKPFKAIDIERRFRLTRTHAAMELSRLARGPHPIKRKQRGVYLYQTG